MSEIVESHRDDPHRRSVNSAPRTPVEIDVAAPDPEASAIEILRQARHRLSTGPSPCAADSERLLARTAWLLFERGTWTRGQAEPVREALERLLPTR